MDTTANVQDQGISAKRLYIAHKPGVGLYRAIGQSPQEDRYNAITARLRRVLYGRPGQHKDVEMEVAQISHEIKTYGFEFVPEHFVTPLLEKLERLAVKIGA